LEVHEVLGLRIGSGLVFLSGCETGLGASASAPSNRVEDYASLAQSFLFAGARDVVSTLWRIEDEGAADFATRFYSQLGAGDATYALAMAQRESIAKVGNSRPFYWAAYQVSGAGELGAAAHTSRPRSVKP